MLRYAQVRHRYFEKSVGVWAPSMVRLWDDLFEICERTGHAAAAHALRHLLDVAALEAPPYNQRQRSCTEHPSQHAAVPADAQGAIKARLSFAVERWGGSGRAVRLGPLERDPPRSGGRYNGLLAGIHP
jgi:mannan endo-1,4-beta-mannosidase